MSRYICIIGDSYCDCRDNEENHWPAYLSNKLNLKLTGSAFPGQSWWRHREAIIKYKNTDKFADTEYFVFAHTDFRRVLTANNYFENVHNDEVSSIREVWFKYMQDDNISHWITHNWYKELNTIMEGKKVIHLQGFETTILDANLLTEIGRAHV